MSTNSRKESLRANDVQGKSKPCEYERDLQPSDFNVHSLPKIKKVSQSTSSSSCTSNTSRNNRIPSDGSDDVIMLPDTAKDSKQPRNKFTPRNLSASSLPQANSTHTSSAYTSSSTHISNSSANTSSSTHTNNTVSDIALFSNCSKGYLDTVKKNTPVKDLPRRSTRNTTKKNTRFASVTNNSFSDEVSSGEERQDDDDDFQISERSSKRGTKTKSNATTFYNQTSPDSSSLVRASLHGRKKHTGASVGGSEDNPVLLDEGGTGNIGRKTHKLMPSKAPTLSSKDEFESVPFRVKAMNFMGNHTTRATKLTIGPEDVKIYFIDKKDTEVHTFMSVKEISSLQFSMNNTPYMLVFEFKHLILIRLMSFFDSIEVAARRELIIITELEEGVPNQGIRSDTFFANIGKIKPRPFAMSDPDIQKYLQRLEEGGSKAVRPTRGCKDSTRPSLKPILKSKPVRPARRTTRQHTSTLPTQQSTVSSEYVLESILEENGWEESSETTDSKNTSMEHEKRTSMEPQYTDSKCILSYNFHNLKPSGSQFMINGQDMNSLGYQAYLNDQIVNFFLRKPDQPSVAQWDRQFDQTLPHCVAAEYFWNELDERIRDSVYIFSSFFYTRLMNSSRDTSLSTKLNDPARLHNRVLSWTKGVNIFEKKYILVPVCYRSHWFIAILCNIGEFEPPHPLMVPPKQPPRKRKSKLSNTRRKKGKATKCDSKSAVEMAAQEELDDQGEGEGETPVISDSDNAVIVEGDDDDAMSIDEVIGIENNEIIAPLTNLTSDPSNSDISSDIERMEVDGDEYGRGSNEECGRGEVIDVNIENDVEEVTCIAESPSPDVISLTTPTTTNGLDDTHEVTASDNDVIVEGSTSSSGFHSNEEIKSCLMVLDSMLVKRKAIGTTLKKYLNEEYKQKYFGTGKEKDFTHLPTQWPEVPPQTNGFDCGIFMLTYVETFFKHIEKGKAPSVLKGDDWIGESNMGRKRQRLRQKILELKATANCSSSADQSFNSDCSVNTKEKDL